MLKSSPMTKMQKVVLLLMLILALGISFFSGFLAHSLIGRSELKLLNEAYQLVDTHYIEALPEGLVLQRGMVRGMLNALDDPFTRFSEPQQHTIQSDALAGEYGGIGALVTTDGVGKFFLAPFPEGPAASAEVLEGTQILAIDGIPIDGDVSLESVVSQLRGLVGTHVMLRIRQPGSDKAETLDMVRVNIPLPSVADYILPGYAHTGVIAISTFSEKTPDEVRQSLQDLMGRGVDKLIVDLRNNGGGLLNSAVDVSRLFLREGIIVYEERRGSVQTIYDVLEPGAFVEIPIVLIVDATTASAAEVVSAALRANGRARLIGDTTFGKGSVQVVVELSDGSSMRITSSRWLTPDDEMIDSNGLEPDINLGSEVAGSEIALIRAAELLDEGFEN